MSKTNEKFGYQGQKLYITSLRQFYNTNEPNTNKIHKPLTKQKRQTTTTSTQSILEQKQQ